MGEVISFGFIKGKPPEVDRIFDVRVVCPNPYKAPGCGEKNGLHQNVISWLEAQPVYHKIIKRIVATVVEGKYERIGIGCVGGKHRSVAIAEAVGRELGWTVKHRNL